MKFFLDTASLKDISWAAQAGLIDGVTTNPSLLAKQAGDLDPRGAGHLRQLSARDADPGGLDPPPPARGGGGDDRRGRGDAASGRPQEAAAAPAHRPRARAVSRGLEPAGGAREGRGLTYLSPLGQRYASPAMQALWGERRRIGLWRRLWLRPTEAEPGLGLYIPDPARAGLRTPFDH